MRISSVVRVLEDQTIACSSMLGAAGKRLYQEAAIEARARAKFNAEIKQLRDERLVELREIVKQTDALHASQPSEADVLRAENEALKAQLAAAQKAARSAKRAATKARR